MHENEQNEKEQNKRENSVEEETDTFFEQALKIYEKSEEGSPFLKNLTEKIEKKRKTE